MLITEFKIAETFNDLEILCRSLKKLLEGDQRYWDEITLIEKKFDELLKMLPPLSTDRINAFNGHISWVKKNKTYAMGNLKDILEIDIPEIKTKYYEYIQNYPELDPSLKEGIGDSLSRGEFDSAIRTAFVIFKDRTVKLYKSPKSDDGEKLINFLLESDTGKIRIHEDEGKRRAFKNYVLGFFSFYRNETAHNSIDYSESETEAIISTINMLLIVLTNHSDKSKKI